MHITSSNISTSVTQAHIREQEESLTVRKPTAVDQLNLTAKDKELLMTNVWLYLLAQMLEAQTGKKVDLASLAGGFASGGIGSSSSPVYDYHFKAYEKNSLEFASSGSVVLEDGSEINFSLNIAWMKEFAVENRLSIQDNKILADPLVISFGADEPLVADTFAFNLNKDIKNLNFTSSHAGYLVHDKNNDGIVNDGSELFGPSTGKGFLELSQHDQDKNGWIDEKDDIFKQLKIWVIREDEDRLFSLEEAGIGAISLSSSAISYLAKDSIDNTFAHYKNASVALGESGGAFGVFEVDIAV